jgi:ubiquinone biosynthesis protein
MLRPPRHLGRYREIVEVLVRHGFGAAVSQLGVGRRLGLPLRLLRLTRSPEDHVTPAQHLRLALEELGPTFIKFGQIVSTRPDLLPPDFIAELSRLQDQAPPEPWEPIKGIIEEELGQPIETIFSQVNPIPTAAASLGQVHAATLADGQEVIIKVQRPNIEHIIDIDLDILYDMARLAQNRTPLGETYNLIAIAEDFAFTLRGELDYRREGHNADRFRENFQDEPYLYIPQIHWDYTTRRVLVMERISGIKIDEVEALDEAGYDRDVIAEHSARMITKEILEDGYFHADPHPGNFFVMENEVIGLMDYGMVGFLSPSDKEDLARLYVVAMDQDVPGAADQLMRMGVADYRVDRIALERDLRRMMHKYYGLLIQELQVGEMIEEFMTVAFRHRLRFPSNLWLVAKTMAMIEGLGTVLAPDFDMFGAAQEYVKRYRRRMWLPTEWGPSVLRGAMDMGDLMLRLPKQTTRLMEQAEQGNLEAQIRMPDMLQATDRLDRIANRLALSMLTAAFTVAIAWVIPSLELAWPWEWLTWFVLAGFMGVSFLGIWLMWSIWRSGRP